MAGPLTCLNLSNTQFRTKGTKEGVAHLDLTNSPSRVVHTWEEIAVGKEGVGENRVLPEFWCSEWADAEGLPHAFHAALGECLAVGSYGLNLPAMVEKGTSR